MRCLALDASTEVCSVALCCNGALLSRRCDQPRSHAQQLLPMVDEVLGEAGVGLDDLDGIALTHGPGSFTGIRICISVAQGLAYGVGLPLRTVSSLAVLAQTAIDASELAEGATLVAALDARMGELYWAVFSVDGENLRQIQAPTMGSPQQFNQALGSLPAPLVGVGHGWSVAGVVPGRAQAVDAQLKPQATAILSLLQSSPALVDECRADQIEPLYLRNEVTWQKRKRIRTSTR